MGLNVNNAQNTHVSYTNTRLICNTNVHNGCSSNWRADWSKFVGRTYAEVVSSNPYKYELALTVKNKNKAKLQVASSDPTRIRNGQIKIIKDSGLYL